MVVSGCAGGLATKGAGWIDVETRDIRLRTDLAEDDAVALASKWQAQRDALAATAFPCASDREDEPTFVTLFSKAADYRRFGPRDSDAFVEASKPGLAEIPREILMRAASDTAVLRQTLLHQVAHNLTAQCYPQLPPWLNVGLSLFYETIVVEEREVIAGRPKYSIVPEQELSNERSRRPEAITVVPNTTIPPLEDLLAFKFDEFYQYTGLYDTLRERDRLYLAGRYAGAWALTHALMTADPLTRARLEHFMIEVRFGETSMSEAWTDTMRGVGLPQLYKEWTAIQIRYPIIAIAYPDAPNREEPTVRAVTEGEAALHLAARWDWQSEQGRKRADDDLAQSIGDNPDDPKAYVMQAAVAEAAGDVQVAVSALDNAIARAPDDPYVVHAQLVFMLDHPNTVLADPRNADALAASLEATAKTAPEFDVLARYYIDVKDAPMDARYWSARALRRDPACAECRVTAGDVLLAAEQPLLAASMYRRALSLAANDAGFDRQAVLDGIAKAEAASK